MLINVFFEQNLLQARHGISVSSSFNLCSILVSTSDFHSADLGSNPGGGENSMKGFTDSDGEVFILL